MRPQRIGFTALITLLVATAIPFTSKFPDLFPTSPALTQTSDARKAEADRLLQQGFQLFKTNQFQAALQSAQQALTIYRQIGDKAGEETTLRNEWH